MKKTTVRIISLFSAITFFGVLLNSCKGSVPDATQTEAEDSRAAATETVGEDGVRLSNTPPRRPAPLRP